MNEHGHPDDPVLAALFRIEHQVNGAIDAAAAAGTPAQLRTITFDGGGSPPRLTHRDHHGPVALSIGIINPTPVRIYLGLGGEHAQPGNHSFVVPRQSAMVIPVGVDGIEIGADPEDLGAESATIFRLRFETVQPFFLGSM